MTAVEMTAPPLVYAWPRRAAVGKMVTKKAILEHSVATTSLREALFREVDTILWAYRLGPDTLGIPAGRSTSEIHVLQVALKDCPVDDAAMARILGLVAASMPHRPLMFEVTRGTADDLDTRTAVVGLPVAPTSASAASMFAGTWCDVDAVRVDLPVAFDLDDLRRQLVAPLLPVRPRHGESFTDLMHRSERFLQASVEMDNLERRMDREHQFNRKAELRRKCLRQARYLDQLRSGDAPSSSDV